MTVTIDLRAAAEIEAVRLREVRAMPRPEAKLVGSSDVPTAFLSATAATGLHPSVVIFCMRTRIVDGTGRLIEDLIVPVEVGLPHQAARTARRETRQQIQKLFERWLVRVRAVCLSEVARRMTDLAAEYGRGLQRARARESHLRELAEADHPALVQPGLFDHRSTTIPSLEHDGRGEALHRAASLLVARSPETVLLLVVGPAR